MPRLQSSVLMARNRKGYRKTKQGGRTQIMRVGRPMFASLKNTQRSYFYKYKINKGFVAVTGGQSTSYNGISFNLQDIPNYTEFTSLYDEYCISKLAVEMIPRFSALSQAVSTATAGNVNQMATNAQPFITVIDYDDATPPGSRNDLIQYQTAKITRPSQIVRRVFTPKIAVQTYKTSLTSGYMAKGHQWLDCADDTVPHFGLKWAWNQDSNAAADTVLYDIYVTYYVKFRGTR